MGRIHAQVEFPYTTGLPEDVAVNNFWFITGGAPGETEYDAVDVLLNEFYNTTPPGQSKVGDAIGPIVDHTAMHIKLYDASGAGPTGPPDAEYTHTLSNGGGDQAPHEVAVCLSFQADVLAGVPQARRRGRIYLGPLSLGALGPGPSRIAPASWLIASLAASAARLKGNSELADVPWAVYSRVGNAAAQITNGWVDNALDTQRRRGLDATARTTW